MDYKSKYMKYKNKYINLKRTLGGNIKNAIFMLCMLKDHYVLGACIAAFTHKQYINKLNLNIELVIMCDSYIFDKYNKTLSKYFDSVLKIELRSFDLSNKYNFVKNKYTWINFSLSKWECLKYDMYNKILFIDIDMLPNNEDFYKLFEFNTPAFLNIHEKKKCVNSDPFKYSINYSYSEYINNYVEKIGSIDGGICLLKPNKETYNNYIEFTNNLYKNGLYSYYRSGPDETSLFYFYLKKNVNMYNICNDYCVIPWDNPELVKGAKAYNFLSWVKPWRKPLFLSWEEETIWRDIYNIMPHYEKIEKVFNDSITDYINEFNKMSFNRKKKSNNLEFEKKYNKEFKKVVSSPNQAEIRILEDKIYFKNYGILDKNKIILKI